MAGAVWLAGGDADENQNRERGDHVNPALILQRGNLAQHCGKLPISACVPAPGVGRAFNAA